MVSRVLNKNGMSLVEAAAAMVIIVWLMSMIMPEFMQRAQNARFQKTVSEMTAIARASIDFYISQGSCPSGTGQLAPTYMPRAVTNSPFGSGYQISCGANMVSVSNLIPSGLAAQNPEGPLLEVTTSNGQDNIMITQRVPFAFTGRLLYDKKFF